jgi:lysophospholipase L1-like esterase
MFAIGAMIFAALTTGISANPCALVDPQNIVGTDFGQLCKYEAANAALPQPTDHRVVFFGDSITELWGKDEPEFFTGDILDRGISGQTTAQMLVRFRQDVLDLHPRVVHILAGTNDIAGNTGPSSVQWIENNLMSMTEQAQAHGIKVVLASILPAAKYSWRPAIDPIPAIGQINAWMKSYAAQTGATYVDYFDALNDGRGGFLPQYTIDGVHPNAAGYAVMRPLAISSIEAAAPGITLSR